MSRDVNLNRKRKWLRVEEVMEKYVVSKTKSHFEPRNSSGNRVMTRNALTPEQLLRLFEEAPFFIGAVRQLTIFFCQQFLHFVENVCIQICS